MLAAAVLSAAMLCNTTVCAWASAADTSAPQASAAIKTALTAGLEVNEQKLEQIVRQRLILRLPQVKEG